MRAVVLEKKASEPRLTDIDDPESPGRGEVIVKVEAAGVCYRDLLNRKGLMPRTRYPVVMGHEFSGTVAEVGQDTEEIHVGDRVAGLPHSTCGSCRYCLEGRENLCRHRLQLGEEINGCWAEYVRVKSRDLVRVPEEVDAAAASIAGCVLGMIIHALRDQAKVRSGELVLVTGAGGGVGIHAVMLSKIFGCSVIALTSSADKAEQVREAGADCVVVGADMLSHSVREMTGGEGVDVVLECVGEPLLEYSLKSTAWGGRVVLIGNVNVGEARVPIGYMILRENALVGSIGTTKTSMAEALSLVKARLLNPVLTRLPLEKASDALQLLEKRASLGRLVLTP